MPMPLVRAGARFHVLPRLGGAVKEQRQQQIRREVRGIAPLPLASSPAGLATEETPDYVNIMFSACRTSVTQ